MSLENRNALCPGYAKRAPPSPSDAQLMPNDRDIHRGIQFSLAERIESDRHGRSSDSRSSGFAHLPGFPVVLSGPSLLQQRELSQTCTAFPFSIQTYHHILLYEIMDSVYTAVQGHCQYVSNGAECSLLTEPSGNRHIPFPPAHRRICSSPPVTGEPIKYKKSRVESSHRRSPPFSFRPGCAIIPSYTFSASGQTPSG